GAIDLELFPHSARRGAKVLGGLEPRPRASRERLEVLGVDPAGTDACCHDPPPTIVPVSKASDVTGRTRTLGVSERMRNRINALNASSVISARRGLREDDDAGEGATMTAAASSLRSR